MQRSIFDGTIPFKLDKPVRLISLFSGYDSQALALKYLSINFEHYKTCEWAVKSIQALKDLHFKDDTIDYSKNLTQNEIIDFLTNKGISANYNEPMTREQIKRLGEQKQRQIYNNIRATRNLVNIQQVKASDLEIVDVDKYCYLMTYSFPCQDLSKAGLGKGMEKGSGTRSGMLWEVERILDECESLPQILLMENVPDVIGSKNIIHFAKWLEKLEKLGYHCYWQVLNAKDFGVPQNRERCFMVSLLGDYYYEFPQTIKLEHRLKDLLEDSVDEKYYLSDKILSKINIEDNNIKEKIGVDLNSKSVTTGFNLYYVSKEQNLKTKLCNELIMNGKVKENDVIRHSYSTSRMNNMYIQNNQFHDCSPTLDTRCDCLGVVVDSSIKPSVRKNFERDKSIIATSKKDIFTCECESGFNDNKVGIKICPTIRAGNSHTAIYNNYRIRKLTPKECFRLMGVKDEDFDKVAQNQSNASLYHLAGDSIVVNVLMAIFRQMLEERERKLKEIKGNE